VGEIFIWLSGASRQILAECPTERPKYFGLGAAIFITGAMAGVSLAFALVNALKINLTAAIVFAACWGLAIMMLDRLFVVSMHRQRNPIYYFVQAAPRFLMALVIGFVISTPFVLQIFKPEITSEVQQMAATQREKYYAGLPNNPVQLEVRRDQTTYDTLDQTAKSGGTPAPVSDNPQIVAWNSQLNHANDEVQNWTNQLDCQLYGGTSNGVKCQPAYGPVAHDDQGKIDFWQGQADTLTSEIKTLTGQLGAKNAENQIAQEQTAQSQLRSAKDALDSAQTQLADQTNNVVSSINGNDGILEQLKALAAVTQNNFTLQMARLLLFLLFVFIDVMPVFVKLLINLAPAGTYDQLLAEEERTQVQDAENARAARTAARRQAIHAEAAGLRHWYEALRTPMPEARDELLAMRRRLDKQKRHMYEHQQRHNLATGRGLISTGMQPGSSTWPGPLPGQRLGNGHRAWPPPFSGATTNDHQYPEDSAGNGAGTGGAANGNGPDPWTSQQPGSWADTQPQATRPSWQQDPGQGARQQPGQGSRWSATLSRILSFRSARPTFRVRQPPADARAEEPTVPGMPHNWSQPVPPSPAEPFGAADTQPAHPATYPHAADDPHVQAADPYGQAGDHYGRAEETFIPPRPGNPGPRAHDTQPAFSGPEPATPGSFEPEFSRDEPFHPDFSRNDAEQAHEFPNTTGEEEFGDREDEA
jgi:hypothetical protein